MYCLKCRRVEETANSIPFLTGTALPALGVGALSGLASGGVQQLI